MPPPQRGFVPRNQELLERRQPHKVMYFQGKQETLDFECAQRFSPAFH